METDKGKDDSTLKSGGTSVKHIGGSKSAQLSGGDRDNDPVRLEDSVQEGDPKVGVLEEVCEIAKGSDPPTNGDQARGALGMDSEQPFSKDSKKRLGLANQLGVAGKPAPEEMLEGDKSFHGDENNVQVDQSPKVIAKLYKEVLGVQQNQEVPFSLGCEDQDKRPFEEVSDTDSEDSSQQLRWMEFLETKCTQF
jgi:hypothetical protein